jgi:hypothetical protein
MNERADGDAGSRDDSRFATLADAAAENVKDGRAGNDEKE